MQELIAEDLHHVLSRVPKDVRALMQAQPLFLAGGFIRAVIAGEKPSDVDLFGGSYEFLKSQAMAFALSRKGARLHETDNAFTVIAQGRTVVQFIHRWVYGPTEVDKLLSEFDYSIAAACVWWQSSHEPGSQLRDVSGEWRSRVVDGYYADLASKRLRYLCPSRAEDAGGSMLRARKFLGRGYHIEASSLAKVIARLTMGVRGIEDMTEEHRGVVLCSLLREVDPLLVVDGLELVDENNLSSVTAIPLNNTGENDNAEA